MRILCRYFNVLWRKFQRSCEYTRILNWYILVRYGIRYDIVYLACSKKLTCSQFSPPHETNSMMCRLQSSFPVNLVQKYRNWGQDLQKLLQNVYCHVCLRTTVYILSWGRQSMLAKMFKRTFGLCLSVKLIKLPTTFIMHKIPVRASHVRLASSTADAQIPCLHCILVRRLHSTLQPTRCSQFLPQLNPAVY